MKVIGITGGIGSGKSVVSHLLQTMGYKVYDSDTEAKKLMNTSRHLQRELCDTFGPEVYDGEKLNRAELAKKVFNDRSALQRLNAIVHPAVRDDFRTWVLQYSHEQYLFMESAILIEAGFTDLVDEIWFVTAPIDLRIERIMRRNGCLREDAEARISSQSSDSEKERWSNCVIFNDNTTPLIPQILSLL